MSEDARQHLTKLRLATSENPGTEYAVHAMRGERIIDLEILE